MPGILYFGVEYQVPGLNVLSPGDASWVKASREDYTKRDTTWIRQITIHSTKGLWPQRIAPGAGPSGRDRDTANVFSTSTEPSAAAFVIGADGEVACLVDIGKFYTYHATTVNPWSVGIEMWQEADGTIYQATIDACVKLVLFLCNLLGIPFQGSDRVYHENEIIQRLLHGGPDVVGVFGHRDNAWQFPQWIANAATRAKYPNGYSSRGRGDPGDAIFIQLDKAGKMNFDTDRGGDMAFWMNVQSRLNRHRDLQTVLKVDGVCGPSTVKVLRDLGLWNGGVLSVLCNLDWTAFLS